MSSSYLPVFKIGVKFTLLFRQLTSHHDCSEVERRPTMASASSLSTSRCVTSITACGFKYSSSHKGNVFPTPDFTPTVWGLELLKICLASKDHSKGGIQYFSLFSVLCNSASHLLNNGPTFFLIIFIFYALLEDLLVTLDITCLIQFHLGFSFAHIALWHSNNTHGRLHYGLPWEGNLCLFSFCVWVCPGVS